MNCNSLIILFLLLMATACSQKGSNVNLKVSSNFIFGGAQLQSIAGGGLMVWGQSTTGETFGQALEDKDELKLSLQNGTWTFYAMAWDGSKDYAGTVNPSKNTPFGGVARCGKSSQVSLDGNPVSVSLAIETAGCNSSDFLATAGLTSGEMPKLKVQFCSDITNISASTNTCTDDLSVTSRKSYRAPVGSYRIKFNQFKNKDKLPAGISSSCVSVTENIYVPNLPAGGPGLPFRMSMEYFVSGANCEATGSTMRGTETLDLPTGVAQATPGSKYFTDITYHYQFVQLTADKVCAGRVTTTLGDHPFAAGDGSANHPFVICSVPQWHAINDYAAFSSSYKLQAHLDFNPYSIGLGLPSLSASANCLEKGTNFLPIGYNDAFCPVPGGDLDWGNLASFTGNFSGNGFSLKNLRLRAEKKDHIGLFGQVGNIGRMIGDFTLEKPEISGRFRVGAVAGEASSTTLSYIKINGMDLEGRPEASDNGSNADVGGLVGYYQNGTINKVIITNSRVRGENSRVGGVVGLLQNATMQKISAEVDIDANSGTSKSGIGGLVGSANSAQLNYVKHEGGINTNGTQVGGLVGYINGTSSIKNFYTISSVFTQDGAQVNKLGGVIGWWNNIPAAQELGPGYSLSQVKSTCQTACAQGSITGFLDGDLPTSTALYVLPNIQSGAGSAPGTVPNGISNKTLSDIKSPGLMTALTDVGTDDWKLLNGEYPRFDFENHPCVNGLSGSGAGTSASPAIVCNEVQYQNLASSANASLKLMANIRLPNDSTLQYDIPTFSAKLNGNDKALIGGNAEFAADLPTAHIGTLNGSITNLKIHGMGRKRTPTSTQAAAVFIQTNNGLLHTIDVNTHAKIQQYGSGFVANNASAGKLYNIRYNGRVEGEYALASLAYLNTGTIENAKVNGELICNMSSCGSLSSLVSINAGSILKVVAGTHLQDRPGYATSMASMIVDQNLGLVQDVVVPSHTTFRVSGMNAYYFHRANLNVGIFNRVVNYGKLIFSDSTPGVPANNFPSTLSASSADQGTHNNVLRGGVSGKELLFEVPFTCSDLNTPVVGSTYWSTLSIWTSSFTAYNSGDKKLIAILNQDGNKSLQHITALASNTLTIPDDICTTGGKLSLYWTDDIMVTSGTSTPAAGAILPQFAGNVNNYGGVWRPLIWDSSNVVDQQAMLDYYAFMMGITATNPGTPAIWELDDDGELRIFNID